MRSKPMATPGQTDGTCHILSSTMQRSVFLVLLSAAALLCSGCAAPGTRQTAMPKLGAQVEFHGKLASLLTRPGASLVIFAADSATVAQGIRFYGFRPSELPQQYHQVAFGSYMGLRGRFAGTTTVPFYGRDIVLGLVEAVEPILQSTQSPP